jgi:hypothetical protein
MTTTNLPARSIEDSAAGTRLFFDSYGQDPLEFNANDVSATIGFFESKGFDNDAALVVSTVLLKQAKIDDAPIFQLLDTLKGFTSLQLSQLVGEVLNNNRTSTSTLGFRTENVSATQTRNISA